MMDTLREILLCVATPTIVILSLVTLGWMFRVDRKPRENGRLARFRGWLRLWWTRFLLVEWTWREDENRGLTEFLDE